MRRAIADLGWLPVGILAAAVLALLWLPVSAYRWLHARSRLFWDSVRLGAVFVALVFYSLGLVAGLGGWVGRL